METERFDFWTRALGDAVSRRDALRAALGGGLGLALGRFALDGDAEAKQGNGGGNGSLKGGHKGNGDGDGKGKGRHKGKGKKRKHGGKGGNGNGNGNGNVGGGGTPTSPPPTSPPPPPTCPEGRFGIAGRCARLCTVDTDCGAGGLCTESFEGFRFCAPNIAQCAAIPVACADHNGCGNTDLCTVTGCGAGGTVENHCVPFL